MSPTVFNFINTFAAINCNAKPTFLGLLPWYYYLQLTNVGSGASGGCEVANFVLLGPHSTLLLVLLVIVEDLLRLAGLFAVIYVIYAGFKYVMSQGSPDEVGQAQTSIRHAITGLVIALVAIPITSYVAALFVGNNAGTSGRIAGLDLGTLPFVPSVAGGGIVAALLIAVFRILGVLSLLFVVIGGYSYVTSNGEPAKAGKAKNTIIYALVGLAVGITAQSFISFVVNKL